MLFASFAENVVMVVDFRLGRLENTAPVHKSKLRKRVDFYFGFRGISYWSVLVQAPC